MIVLTFFVFVFSMFFFVLLLSYVFADGELNFNYFALEAKSCFMNRKFLDSKVVFRRQRHQPVLITAARATFFTMNHSDWSMSVIAVFILFLFFSFKPAFTFGNVSYSKQDLASTVLSLLPFHHYCVFKWFEICLNIFNSSLFKIHVFFHIDKKSLSEYVVQVVTTFWPSQPSTVFLSYQTPWTWYSSEETLN